MFRDFGFLWKKGKEINIEECPNTFRHPGDYEKSFNHYLAILSIATKHEQNVNKKLKVG